MVTKTNFIVRVKKQRFSDAAKNHVENETGSGKYRKTQIQIEISEINRPKSILYNYFFPKDSVLKKSFYRGTFPRPKYLIISTAP